MLSTKGHGFRERARQLAMLLLVLSLNVALGAAESIEPQRHSSETEDERLLLGIIESTDPNPGVAVPLPGPLQSPPGYVAPARFNASQFAAPPPIASVQCNPPCLNGGLGKLGVNGACTCTCLNSDNTAGSTFYTGLQCQTEAVVCNQYGFYCSNGGICPAKGLGSCTCTAPFYGTQCEFQGTLCGAVNCQNGATCGPDANSLPVCNCIAGYTGSDCSTFDPKALAAAAQTPGTITSSNGVTPTGHGTSSGTKWYYIFIGVVGGVAVCCTLAIVAFLLLRRRNPTRAPSSMKQDSLAKQDAAIQMEDLRQEGFDAENQTTTS